jgi:high-affinity iron transporter
MARSLFSIPIFFIVFRETLEVGIILSVLLGLVEQIAHADSISQRGQTTPLDENDKKEEENIPSRVASVDVDDVLQRKRLLRKMRWQACSTPHIRYIPCH